MTDELSDLTLGRMLAAKAMANGEKACVTFVQTGERLSYADVDRATNRLANGLKRLGVGRGDHVAVLSENRPEQILAYFALAKLGAASVPVNTAAKGYFLERFVGQSDSIAVIIEPEFLANLAAVVGNLPNLQIVVLLESLENPDQPVAVPPELQALNILDYRDVAKGDDARVDDAEPRDLLHILYTSGTTGPSKGNMYGHTAVLNWARQLSRAHQITPDDVYFVVFPLFHAGAWLSSAMTVLWQGGTVAVGRRFSASQFWRQARGCGATVSLVAGGVAFIVAQPPSAEDRDHSIRQLCCGPLPADPTAFEARFGVRLVSALGMSDFGVSHGMGPSAPREKLGSCGTLLPDVDARVVDDDDHPVPVGRPGELLLRNNTPGGSASGYYKMPEATLESRRDLWFHTGDIVYADADGYFYFVDRKKDAIRRRGENISSLELEMVVGRHEAVAACAIFPVKADVGEEEVATAVVLKSGASLAEAELVAYCSEHMPAYAVPRYVRIVDSLPQTASGKVEKLKLRAETEAKLSEVWDRDRLAPARSTRPMATESAARS